MTINNLRNSLVRMKDKIPFIFAPNSVYRLGYVDGDAFCSGELSLNLDW